MIFQVGDKVIKILVRNGERISESPGTITSIRADPNTGSPKEVAYFTPDGDDEEEWGITYNPGTGMENELFFAGTGMVSKIEKAAQ